MLYLTKCVLQHPSGLVGIMFKLELRFDFQKGLQEKWWLIIHSTFSVEWNEMAYQMG